MFKFSDKNLGPFFFTYENFLKLFCGRCRAVSGLNSFACDRGKKVVVLGPHFDFRSQPEVTGKITDMKNFDKIK